MLSARVRFVQATIQKLLKVLTRVSFLTMDKIEVDDFRVERQQLEDAISSCDQPEEKASLLLKLAWLEFTLGNFIEAEACVTNLLEMYPDDIAGLSALHSISSHSGNHKRAVTILKQILTLEDCTDTKFILAHTLIKVGGMDNLLEAYYIARSALEESPNSILGWFILAFVYNTLKLRQKAYDAAEKGLASDVAVSEHVVYQVEAYILKVYLSWYVLRDKKRGLFYAHKTLSIIKRSYREIPIVHHLRLANFLEKLGDIPSALNLYESAVHNNIRLTAPSLIRFYFRRGMFRKAISLLRNYLFLPPSPEETRRLTQVIENWTQDQDHR